MARLLVVAVSAPVAEGMSSYEQALASATALRAAVAAPSPADVVSVTSEQVASVRQRSTEFAVAAIGKLWRGVDPYNPRQVAEFAKSAAGVMESAQSAAGRAAAAGQVRQLAALGVTVDGRVSVPVDVRAPSVRVSGGRARLVRGGASVDYAGDGPAVKVSAADMSTEQIFTRPADAFRVAESQGRDGNAAAQARIEALVDGNVMLAQRLAQAEVLAEAVDLDRRKPNRKAPKVIGYRRVIHPELSRGGVCGMCVAASDRRYHVEKLLPIHARCHCTVAPITTAGDPGDEVNAVDLAALYGDGGGTSAAHLKRARYKVDDHGELGAVLVPKSGYNPRSEKSRKLASGTDRSTTTAPNVESKADVARRHLPQLEKNLKVLLANGLSESAPQVLYHRAQIARLKGELNAA